jgi:hypothetical protein
MADVRARGIDASGNEVQLPVPSEDLIVKDHVGVERKLFAGQPVPRDLLDAYNEAINAPSGAAPAADDSDGDKGYASQSVDELKDKLRSRDLPVSGTKDELVARLEADDEETAAVGEDEGGEGGEEG